MTIFGEIHFGQLPGDPHFDPFPVPKNLIG